jgi:CO dehydrogenase/acetyl-CoA synthase epsilon subunit
MDQLTVLPLSLFTVVIVQWSRNEKSVGGAMACLSAKSKKPLLLIGSKVNGEAEKQSQ